MNYFDQTVFFTEKLMQEKLNRNGSYSNKLPLFCILTALFGFACIMLGYLFLPLAASAFASLLLYENKNKRIFSYVIPVALYAINVIFNGFFSLEAIVYVAVGLILYFFTVKGRNKNETVFWIAFAISVFILLSFVAVGFSSNSSVSFGALRAYYAGIYDSLKRIFIEIVSSLHMADDEGVLFFIFTRENAENIFHSLLLDLPSLIIILSLILTAVTIKIFDTFRVRSLGESREALSAFMPPKFIAVAYIFTAILWLFASSSGDLLAITVRNLNNVFTALFFYLGFTKAFSAVKNARGAIFAVLLLVVSLFVFAETAITLLAFIGTFAALKNSNK